MSRHLSTTIVVVALAWLGLPLAGYAEDSLVNVPVPDSHDTKAYTEEHPLIYEDVWDLWPYSFLNDNGQPDGFNVDLIRMMMKELGIPYRIILKPSDVAFNDLKNGKSDLMLGLAVGFHDEFGQYSKNSVTLFTQSVVTPKNKPIEIKGFRDLEKHKVIVNDSSLCHHLMMDYGWEKNAIPAEDMREAIQQVSANEEGQIVWNTLSLKWLMNRYHTDNLEITPVNMPHGQYKFMSNNPDLLDLLDETYTRLYSGEKLTPIQNKWFYPERQEKKTPHWVWWVIGIAALLILTLSVYFISYRMQSRKLKREANMRNKRLALILQTSHVRIWTYDIKENRFTWRNDNGQIAYTYTMDEFAQRYHSEDFVKIKEALDRLANSWKKSEEEEIALNVRAKDVEGGDTEDRDYNIVLSVLNRDKQGKATQIIGTKKDVTEEHERQRLSDERTQRYWAIFNNSMVGILLFNRDGILTNINTKACELYDCDRDEMISQNITIDDLFDTGTNNLDELDNFYATQIADLDRIPRKDRKVTAVRHRGKLHNEFRLMTVYDDNDRLLGIFAICRDVTDVAMSIDREREGAQRVETVKDTLANYADHINRTLENSDIRMVYYSPDHHTLTFYSSTTGIEHALTQTRCMTLVDDRSKKLAMRLLNDMDDRTDRTIEGNIRTTLRVRGGLQLELYFRLVPIPDHNGHVKEYFGVVRNFSTLRSIEQRMAQETAKVQEVENTKNSFIKNMIQDIRTPMNTVLGYVAQLADDKPLANEAELREGILNNADYLLHLIDNILYLSRLEAHMVEIRHQPRNFAELFESQCQTGWMKHQNANTRFVVENPYEQLVIDIDAENLGHAIGQVCANAAQHTTNGAVRARYDYIGHRLMVFIEDTGEGIDCQELARLNAYTPGSNNNSKGLGLAICKELIHQMGGTFEINSDKGIGTTVFLTIPCHASAIKRKKLI